MDPCNVFNGTYEGSGSNFPCYDASQHYGGPTRSPTSIGGPTGVATGSVIGRSSADLAAGEAAYASNFGWQATGSLYGKPYNQFFSSLDAYFDWRTSIGALPESKAYQAFAIDCAHSSAPCGSTMEHAVIERTQGLLGNYATLGTQLDRGTVENLILDPLHDPKNHPGDSWYSKNPFDPTHIAVIPSGIVETHFDTVNPIYFAPIHGLIDYLPSLFINPSPGRVTATYNCSIIGGCH